MKLSTLSRNLDRIEAYLAKQEAVLSAQAPEWFKKMTKEEQKTYLKEHPGSKLKVGNYKRPEGKKPEGKKPEGKKFPVTPKSLADRVEKIAQRYSNKNRKSLKEAQENGDKGMIKMLEEDKKDLIKLAQLIKHKDFRAARKLHRSLDTAVKDEIPNSILDGVDSIDPGYRDYEYWF